MQTSLNAAAEALLLREAQSLARLGVVRTQINDGWWYDFSGCPPEHAREAGMILAKVCCADQLKTCFDWMTQLEGPRQRSVHLVEVAMNDVAGTAMSCQYGGMFVQPGGKWYGLGSGPMRRLTPNEPLIREYPAFLEQSGCAVGVIETAEPVTPAVIDFVAGQTGVPKSGILLCTAPATCLAGTVQVACRVIETAAHVWHHRSSPEDRWDVGQLKFGHGTAVVAPPAAVDEESMVRMNEAIALTGCVQLHVDGLDDVLLRERVKRLVFSHEFPGKTFRQVYADHGNNLGKMFRKAPFAFAPAMVTLVSSGTGSKFAAGEVREDLLDKAWADIPD